MSETKAEPTTCWHDNVETTLGGDDWCIDCGSIAGSLYDDGQVALWREPKAQAENQALKEERDEAQALIPILEAAGKREFELRAEAERELRNLLAIIHRDGGHYYSERRLYTNTSLGAVRRSIWRITRCRS